MVRPVDCFASAPAGLDALGLLSVIHSLIDFAQRGARCCFDAGLFAMGNWHADWVLSSGDRLGGGGCRGDLVLLAGSSNGSIEEVSMMTRWACFLLLLPVVIPAAGVLRAWQNSPMDRVGIWAALVAGCLVLLFHCPLWKARGAPDSHGWVVACLGLFFLSAGLWSDVRLVTYTGAWIAAFSVVWIRWGAALFAQGIPLLGLVILSLPGMAYVMKCLWLRTGLAAIGTPSGIVFPSIVLGGLFCGIQWMRRNGVGLRFSRIRNGAYWCGVALGGCLLLVPVRQSGFERPFNLVVEEGRVGGWVGVEVTLSPAEQSMNGGRYLKKFAYHNRDGELISVLVADSGGNLHRLHSPIYCMSGAGWTVETASGDRFEVDGGGAVDAMTVAAERDGLRVTSLCWYSSAQHSTASYYALRFAGRAVRKENWVMYSISTSASDPEQTLTAFLSELSVGR
jgi:hypothetical protein